MTPSEGINHVYQLLNWLDKLKTTYPNAHVRATSKHEGWKLSALTGRGRGTLSIEEREQDFRSVLNRLEKLKAEHPNSYVYMQVKDKHCEFGAILGPEAEEWTWIVSFLMPEGEYLVGECVKSDYPNRRHYSTEAEAQAEADRLNQQLRTEKRNAARHEAST